MSGVAYQFHTLCSYIDVTIKNLKDYDKDEFSL